MNSGEAGNASPPNGRLRALTYALLLAAAASWGQPAKKQSPRVGVDHPLVTAGEFARIYDPSVGEKEQWYINDHCFVRRGEAWHLFGITNHVPIRSYDEDQFAHATAAELTRPRWEKQPFALTTDPAQGETHLWAPHIIEHGALYYMFYCAGGEDRTSYGIHLAMSPDLEKWTRYGGNPLFRDGYEARDPFVLRLDNQWIMYYTATAAPGGGNFIVAYRTSADLREWSERRIAYTDPKSGTVFGNTESPFVVRRGANWYLFIGPRGGYMGTDVFRGDSPYSFDVKDRVGHIESHAAEVVRDADGAWYVSHCGWSQKGVYLAPLSWHDGADDFDTSMSIPPSKAPANGNGP